ncbi:hypothetical protein [Acinetobacter nosocomialis]|uniref:hypothetical protein n=1 Tax=Acinetobacter nosocomialis TaxID=106654 RepID=UPI001250BB85|nr:hypothetical protein [Acinetobacter nosocomialis]
MKPEQFIREQGLDKAREVVEGRSNTYMPELFKYWSEELQDYVLAPKYASFLVEDLKRLVESVDRVNAFGGLKDAKAVVKMGKHYKYLKAHISNYESIYGGGDE